MDTRGKDLEPTGSLLRIVEPDDEITFQDHKIDGIYQFDSPERVIPHLGLTKLFGSKFRTSFTISEDEKVVVTNGVNLVRGTVAEVKGKIENLYELDISIRASRPPENLMVELELPEILKLSAKVEAREDNQAVDPNDKYYVNIDDWQDESANTVRFFVPPDAKFLSRLGFRFYTGIKQ